MNIELKNLGALKQASFSLGDLTIICGMNNTGKTYATYALFGFLHSWREFLSLKIEDDKINQLLAEGVTHLELSTYISQSEVLIKSACQEYTKELPRIFAAQADRFKETVFSVTSGNFHSQLAGKYERKMRAANTELFYISKQEGSTDLVVSLLVEKDKVRIPTDMITHIIEDAIKDILFAKAFPNPFIASAERTGAAIFRKELNFARNRLLEEMSQAGKNINPMDLLFKVYQDYALPVERNVDFTRQLESIAKKNSFIVDQHPEILADFADIIGGEYTVTRNDELYYVPKGKKIKLTMDESSSAVRSLLDIGFYLRHVAQPGDLLMVDEPELNLHPENQRRVARLFARLVNVGVKVFITTHSDYIIKELNTLLMLNNDKPHLKRIAQTEKYQDGELLAADKIRVYIAEEAQVMLDGNKRKTKCQTLTAADISQELGIEARSFDITIEAMNRIQEDIVWGGE
jgi:AAA15 family ATPase/GTPase